jgi:hypothetical protein
LRVRGDDEDVIVCREVGFEPDHGAQVEMVRWLIYEGEDS